METGELVLAILTLIAVVVALGIGIASIRQTQKIQEKQYKYARFKEIKGWAKEVMALIDEQYRWGDTQEWNNRRANLRAALIDIASQAEQISDESYKRKIEKAINLFAAFDQDIANKVRSSFPNACRLSCVEVIKSNPVK